MTLFAELSAAAQVEPEPGETGPQFARRLAHAVNKACNRNEGPAMSKRNRRIVDHDGPACPRCRRPLQVREHVEITQRELARSAYYRRWFYCSYPDCRTTTVMFDEDRVSNRKC